jgi:hypothetical protein
MTVTNAPTGLPRVRVGSVLRDADGRRFVVRSIHKVATQPHTPAAVQESGGDPPTPGRDPATPGAPRA